MTEHVDLLIVGSGTAATTVAGRCADKGWRVMVADKAPFGGTCALRGCDPKKLFYAGAELADLMDRLAQRKVIGSPPPLNWAALLARKRAYTQPIPDQTKERLAQQGVVVEQAPVRFRDPQTAEVGDRIVAFGKAVIASGAVPVPLPIEGHEHIVDSAAFLDWESLPRKIAFIGGGYVSFELAHIAAAAGSEVTIFQRGDRVLEGFDPDLVQMMLKERGHPRVRVLLGHGVRRIEADQGSYRIFAGDTAADQGRFDAVVHGAGRVPALDGLALDNAGIETERRRLKLNVYLQSVSNPAVYAAGDAAGMGPALTPVAATDGNLVAENLLTGNTTAAHYDAIPTALFSLPPLARVGLLEPEAREQGLDFSVKLSDGRNWYTARRSNEPVYGAKIMVDNRTGLIIGAHIVGPEAAETINLFAFAMQHHVPAGKFKDTLFAYPTAASDVSYFLP